MIEVETYICGCSRATYIGGCPIHLAGPETVKTVIEPGRFAECPDCKAERPSSPNLAFFMHQPQRPKDRYYCGCLGWN